MMLQVDNRTEYEAALHLLADHDGVETVFVVVKASFMISAPARIAAEHLPVLVKDEYRGEPDSSSMTYPSDLHLGKQHSDICLLGRAWAPTGQEVRRLHTSLHVGPYESHISVVGDRVAGQKPKAFSSMPLVYERAYGGTNRKIIGRTSCFERNPVGRDFGSQTQPDEERALLPNLLRPDGSDRSNGPACFAPIAPWWSPRIGYRGTYDEAWQRYRAPYLPQDFDSRFFQVAPKDLIAKGYLQGGEDVRLNNLSATGPVRFRLPTIKPHVELHMAGRTLPLEAHLETLLIEPDEDRYSLSWRCSQQCDKQALKVTKAVIDFDRTDAA